MQNSIIEKLVREDYELDDSPGRYCRGVGHDSLIVDRQRELFFWNSRGLAGDARAYLKAIRGYSDREVNSILGDIAQNNHIFTVEEAEDAPEIVPFPDLVDAFYNFGKAHTAYWLNDRGYTEQTISRFKLGFTGKWYTIPIFEGGKFINFQLRRKLDDGNKQIRPWYRHVGPHAFNFSTLKFTDWVVITEGPPDAIMLRQNDIPAVSHTAGSASWMDQWTAAFAKTKKIYVVYDNDVAGTFGSKKLGRIFGNKCFIYNMWDFAEKFDITDYFKNGGDRESFLAILRKGAVPYYKL